MGSRTASLNRDVSHLVVTWVLMIPLVFFAVSGAIRFDAYTRNNALEASYTSLVTSGSHGLTQLSLAVVFSVCALLFCTRLRGVGEVAKQNKLFVILAVFALASSAWSQFPRDSLLIGTYATINIWFAFYLAARFRPDRQMLLVMTVGWVVILSSIAAVLCFPTYGTDRQGASVFGSWIGIFPHKNWCSIMVTFLLSGALYTRPSSSLSRMARFVYVGLSLLLIVMSQSRTGWVVGSCLLVYVTVTTVIKRFRTNDRLFLVLCGSGALAMASIVVVQYYRALTLLIGKDATLTGRTKIWPLVMHAIMVRPLLGYGYRGFWHGLEGASANISLADRWIVPAAHNGFLDMWLGLGAVGLGLVACSFVQAIRNGIICLSRGSSSSAEWYLCIVFLTVIGNVAELTLMVPQHLAWILYVVACVGLSQEAKRGPGWL